MNRNQILTYIAILLCAVFASLFVIRFDFNLKSIGLLVFPLVFLLTIIKPSIGLVVIIISMLFSPDIMITKAASRDIFVRVDDVFLLIVIMAWLIRSAFTKDLSKTIKTPLFPLFFAYILVCLFSSLLSVTFGKVNITISLLSTFKYAQYFIIFLMVRENLKTLSQAKFFVIVFLFVAFVVSLQANLFIQQQISSGATFFRVSPPIESRGGNEANTMGGYLLFMLVIASGLFLYIKNISVRIILFILILTMFRAFMYTLSRGSYIALIPAILALVFIYRKAKFAYLALVIFISSFFFLPDMVKNRISQTFVAKETIVGKYLDIEDSPKERLDGWKRTLFEDFPSSPIIGHGVSRRFVDGQVFMVLLETGLVGLFFFLWILARLFRYLRQAYHSILPTKDQFSSGLCAGFIAAFIGLVFHSLSSNTFIIIRIVEAFWFLAAIVLSLPSLITEKKADET